MRRQPLRSATHNAQIDMRVACGLCCMRSPASLRAGLHVDTLYRVMRAAVNMKLLTAAPGARGQPPRFANAALGEALRDDHPNNAWPMVGGQRRRALFALVNDVRCVPEPTC